MKMTTNMMTCKATIPMHKYMVVFADVASNRYPATFRYCSNALSSCCSLSTDSFYDPHR